MRRQLVRPRKGSLRFGAVYALCATLVGGLIATLATGEGYGMLPLYAAVGGFVGGAGAWRLLVAPLVAPRALRGAVAGVLAAPVGGGGLTLSLFLGWLILPVGALIGFVCAR
jgi:hypothetical protein